MSSNTVKTVRDGQLTLKDGTGTPVTLVVDFEGEGNFTFSDDKSERLTIMDRGSIVGCRKQNDVVKSASFSVNMRQFSDSSGAGSIIDFIMKTGHYAANISTGGAAFGDFYLIDVEFRVEGTDFGDTGDHFANLTKCLASYDFAEGFPDVININLEVYGTITRSQA